MKNGSLIILLFLVFFSCNRKEKPFFRGEMRQISFTEEYYPEEEFIKTDSIRNLSVDIAGDYLLLTTFSQPYFTKIYDKNSGEYFGEFFRQGKGPEDFMGFRIQGIDYPFLYVKDYVNKTLSIIDIEKTIIMQRPVINRQLDLRNIVDPYCVFYVSDTCLIIKDLEHKGKGLYCLQYNPSTRETVGKPLLLYNYMVSHDLIHKIYSLADGIKPDGSIYVSLVGRLDQVDFLNVSAPEKSFSITTSSNPPGYSYLAETHRDKLKDYYCSSPVCTNDLVMVLYNNEDKIQNSCEMHVVDWEGRAKCKIILPRYLTTIAFDEEEGMLYGLSGERVYR